MPYQRSGPGGGELSRRRLEAEALAELPDREVLTLIDPSLTNIALGYANSVQSTPISQGTATSNPLLTQGTATPTDAAQNTSADQNTATAQNVNSPGSVSSVSQYQYAPSSTSP